VLKHKEIKEIIAIRYTAPLLPVESGLSVINLLNIFNLTPQVETGLLLQRFRKNCLICEMYLSKCRQQNLLGLPHICSGWNEIAFA